jgi:hypothetical protein
MVAMRPIDVMQWQPHGFTKAAATIGGKLKVVDAALAAVSVAGQVKQQFSGPTASAHSAETQEMMQRLSQGMAAANALVAPLNEVAARLTAAKLSMQTLLTSATGAGLIPNLASPGPVWFTAPTPYQEAAAVAANAAMTTIMAQVNVTDHAGYIRMAAAVAGIVGAVAPRRSSSGGDVAGISSGTGSGSTTHGPTPRDTAVGNGAATPSTSLAGVGLGAEALNPGPVQPFAGAGAGVAAARALAVGAGGGALGAGGAGGFMGAPMMGAGAGAGRGEEERHTSAEWRLTEDDGDIFAARPDPTGGVLS